MSAARSVVALGSVIEAEAAPSAAARRPTYSRHDVMRKAARSMQEIEQCLQSAMEQLTEGDLDLADLIVPVR